MRLKLFLLFAFIVSFSWSQTTKTFNTSGSFAVPSGVTSISVSAWGGGGSGGGASGAGLLFGRGAAGGGGGAFASTVLTVPSGANLNVVVAGQSSGTSGANGTSGGNSTITGYESLFLAAGGTGGGANNAGGTPLGGAGGTVAASAGAVKFAGSNGANGNSWSLLSLLLSSGAGGNGANSGGVGGASVPSLILGTAPGNPGAAPGGGGSGAINSALGTAQAGGAGGAGQVTISYTCPTYQVNELKAMDICGATASTATVSINSSPAGLPVGNYIITYDRSSPSATGLTANMTVVSPGISDFTVTGLSAIGSSTITVTKITSESCSTTVNKSTTINLSPATVGGAVTGGTTIAPGSTSGLLTLSGHTGSVVKWQSSVSPFTTWTDIVYTNTTYTSEPLTETTQFRAVVQSGACSVLNSEPTTVKVENLVSIDLSPTAADICRLITGGQSQKILLPALFLTTISYSGTTGTPITYSIVWNPSPANSFPSVTNVQLPSSPIALYFPVSTADGTYTGTLTVKNASGAVSSGSTFTVKITTAPNISTTGTLTSVTTSTIAQDALLAYSSVGGNPTKYAIDWDTTANAALLTDQPETPFAFSSGGGVINNIIIPANVPPGTYYGQLTILNYDGCSASIPVSITINPVLPSLRAGYSNNSKTAQSNDDSANTISIATYNKAVHVETPKQNIDKVFVYDLSGNLVYKKDSVKNSKLVIDNLKPSNQILIVKVVLDDKSTQTKKVIY